jgi:hypothetical protein
LRLKTTKTCLTEAGYRIVQERGGKFGTDKKTQTPARIGTLAFGFENACRCSVELGRGLLKWVRQGDTPLAITRALSTRSLPLEARALRNSRSGGFPRPKGRAKPSRGKDDQNLPRI